MAPCPDNYSILGKKLYSLLEKLNELSENIYTLEAVSNASDMEPTELCRYLTGRRRPKLHQVMRLLAVFPATIADKLYIVLGMIYLMIIVQKMGIIGLLSAWPLELWRR